MTINDLLIKYSDFIAFIDDIHILSNLSLQIFEEYPKNIPPEIYKPIAESLSYASKILVLDHKNLAETNAQLSPEDEEKIRQSHKISAIFLESAMAKAISQMVTIDEVPSVENPKAFRLYSLFNKIIIEEEFLSYYALFEAYIGNILTIILKKYPQKLNPKHLPKNESKEIRWEDVLQYNNYDDLIDFMVEKYIYSFGYKSLYERFKIFQTKDFGFVFQSLEKIKPFFDETEEIRNCIIHSGGRITNKSLKKLKKPGLKIGEFIQLTTKFNTYVYNKFKTLAFMLFTQTSDKYFKKGFT